MPLDLYDIIAAGLITVVRGPIVFSSEFSKGGFDLLIFGLCTVYAFWSARTSKIEVGVS